MGEVSHGDLDEIDRRIFGEMTGEQLSRREQVLKKIAIRLADAQERRRELKEAMMRRQTMANRVGIDQEKFQRCEQLGLDIEKMLMEKDVRID